jgi:hypothetical protein
MPTFREIYLAQRASARAAWGSTMATNGTEPKASGAFAASAWQGWTQMAADARAQLRGTGAQTLGGFSIFGSIGDNTPYGAEVLDKDIAAWQFDGYELVNDLTADGMLVNPVRFWRLMANLATSLDAVGSNPTAGETNSEIIAGTVADVGGTLAEAGAKLKEIGRGAVDALAAIPGVAKYAAIGAVALAALYFFGGTKR